MSSGDTKWSSVLLPGGARVGSGIRRGMGRRKIATGGFAAVILMAGCADTPNSSPVESGFVGEEHNRVDVMFAQMMIPHHDDAIAMAEYLEQVDGVDPRVDELAAGIVEAQVAENDEMNSWLSERGYSQVNSSPGQVNEEAVAGTSAADIEESFLTEMIAHHEHGVDMARGAANRGQSPVMTGLAQGMVEDQGEEIELMRSLLSEN
ncbi:MAG: DUF305 domain-containing protein [Ornithinimicrobium sp.]